MDRVEKPTKRIVTAVRKENFVRTTDRVEKRTKIFVTPVRKENFVRTTNSVQNFVYDE